MESPTEALDGEIKASRGFRRKRNSVARLDGVSSRLLTTMAIVRATAQLRAGRARGRRRPEPQ